MSIENAPDYSIWVAAGTLALAAVTGVLALLTWRVLAENKKVRTDPVFALEPADYVSELNVAPGEKFRHLHLVNHGAPATDIFARCIWLESEKSGGSSRTFYILSLAQDGYAVLNLDQHLDKITAGKLYVKVEINCKNAAGKPHKSIITNGLDKIRGTDIRIAAQYNYLHRIYHVLEEIRIHLITR